MRKAMYFGNCVGMSMSQVPALHQMIEDATDITYKTLMQHVDRDEVASIFTFYDWGNGRDLTLKRDWAVSYHRSKWRGKRCYYIRHSAIEYIFI